MTLKDDIIDSCNLCNRTGVYEGRVCPCILKFRAFNRLIFGGFNLNNLYLVSDFYEIPFVLSGSECIDLYMNSPALIENEGLSLYIFSREKGRGKTTLAHSLLYNIACYFMRTDHYDRNRDWCFERVDKFLENAKFSEDNWKSTYYVLDDLGSEDRSAPWKFDLFLSSLQQLLHYRRDNKLPTIITSNYHPSDISSIYNGLVDSLLEIGPDGNIGGKLYRQVELGGGEDLRLSDSSWPV